MLDRIPVADRRTKNRMNKDYSGLPDSHHKRKAQKIKNDLIRSAKIKRDFARSQRQRVQTSGFASSEIHPERRTLLAEGPEDGKKPELRIRNGPRKQKGMPFQKESALAQERIEERDRKREAFAKAEVERDLKREKRRRFHRSLQRARRPDRNGQRKLGRESKLLPQMVEGLFDRLDRERRNAEAS